MTVGPSPMTGVFLRGKLDTDTHRESRPHVTTEESDWREAAADQGTPKVASDRQELGRGDGGLSPAVWR